MSAHTPGPWSRDGNFVYALNKQRVPVNRMYFSIYGGWGDTPGERTPKEEVEANARLIAAAPMGYDLAKSVLAWWEQHQWDTQPCGDGDSQNTYDDEPEFVELAKQFIAKSEGRA